MNLYKVSWKNTFEKPLNTTLSVLLMALGIGLISFIYSVSSAIQENFTKNISGIDMVIGAKGSPIQLILSAVFQLDNPTGNIPVDEVEKLRKNRYVGKVIPLSYGDSYNGFRIVGTTREYPEIYSAKLGKGQFWKDEMEVVIGSEVATYNEITVGDTFESAHGLVSDGETHDDHPFRVVGVLESSGTVIDKLILTSTESIWHVHEKPGEQLTKQYTAALVKFRSPMGIIQIPRNINTNTKIQAALPSYEINRLVSLIGIGIKTLTGLATGIMIVAALSIFISLYNKLKERKYEFAVLRSYGASRWQLVSMIMMESFIISLLGSISGIVIARITILISQSYFGSQFPNISIMNFTNVDLYLILTSFFIGIIAAIIPSIESFRMNIHNVLSES